LSRFSVDEADLAQKLEHVCAHGRIVKAVMNFHHLAHLLEDRVQGVERGHRLLEDDGNLLAANVLHLRRRRLEQVPPTKMDFAGWMMGGWIRQQLED
jgi:hypothetical protein